MVCSIIHIFTLLSIVLLALLFKCFNTMSEKGVYLFFLGIALAISLVSQFTVYSGKQEDVATIYEGIQYSLRSYNYFFFALGIYFRKYGIKSRILCNLSRVFSVVLLFIFGVLWFFNYGWLENITSFLMSAAMCVVICDLIQRDSCPKNKLLEELGRQSYGIYLWHELPIKFVNMLIASPVIRCVLHAIFMIFLYVCIKIGEKFKLVRRLLLGLS